MNSIVKAFKNPKSALLYMMKYKPFRLLSDELFLKLEYYLVFGKKLNLKRPQTYNEKLQWLKLNDRNPTYTKMVDKYGVREHIAKEIGEEYLIPLYGVYDSYEEINFDDLPNEFVLKPTHTSGDVFICKDKNKINHLELKNKIKKWQKRKYFWIHREWPYKNVKPRIIAEKYMVDETKTDLKDYKFFCFNGKPEFMFIASNRSKSPYFDFFDLNFNRIKIQQGYPNAVVAPDKPSNFDKMIELSYQLSKGIPHVRVDFYSINEEIYFGELTFYHFSGLTKFKPDKYDKIIGNLIEIPDKKY